MAALLAVVLGHPVSLLVCCMTVNLVLVPGCVRSLIPAYLLDVNTGRGVVRLAPYERIRDRATAEQIGAWLAEMGYPVRSEVLTTH